MVVCGDVYGDSAAPDEQSWPSEEFAGMTRLQKPCANQFPESLCREERTVVWRKVEKVPHLDEHLLRCGIHGRDQITLGGEQPKGKATHAP